MKQIIKATALATSFVALVAIAAPAAAVGSTVVYTNDFESGAGAGWSSTTTSGISPPGDCTSATHCGTTYLGQFADPVSLTLGTLPPHDALTVTFDLFIIDSWDGHGGCCGPDTFGLDATGAGTVIPVASFSNTASAGHRQSFPDPCCATLNPAQSGAVEANTLGTCCDFYGSAVYHFSVTFPHSDPSVVLSFLGDPDQGVGDEGWGIDNVEVVAHSSTVPIPELGAIAFASTGLVAVMVLASLRRR